MKHLIAKRNLLAPLCLVGVLLPAGSTMAEEDPFEALDRQLQMEFEETDARLEAEYQALNQAIEDAYNRLGEEIAAEWGDGEVELPGRSTYVDYSEDKQTRRKVNFEEGVIEIERLVDETGDLPAAIDAVYAAMTSIAEDNMDDLARKDLAARYVREEMGRQGIALAPEPPRDGSAVLKGVTGDLPDRRQLEQQATVAMTSNQRKKVTVKIPLKAGHLNDLAQQYQSTVLKEAARQDLPPSLVYAIMETESHFNPRARSHIPAFGLMQLVPASGGIDAYNFVYGEQKVLGPEYLYDSDQNVELGAAYLKLVYSRYLRPITNPTSRIYCTIAAYNTGAGNVARSFVGTNNVREAAKIINRMSPQEVYNHLITKLPYEETRHYVQKVLKAQQKYQAVDQYAAR